MVIVLSYNKRAQTLRCLESVRQLRYRPLKVLVVDNASSDGSAEAVAAGYPEGGPFTITATRLGRTGTVQSQDSYGQGPVERQMTPFRGEVRNGNSGGPVIDGNGDVLATVFASSVSSGPPSGLGVPNEIVSQALDGRLDGASTGPCTA